MIKNSVAAFPDSKPHYPILDGLRGVAAIMVVWFHIFEAYACRYVSHGYLAVDFFYILSGFVIAYAYDSRWSKLSMKDFLARRVIRLQPMVVIGALLGGILIYAWPQDCIHWTVSKVASAIVLSTLMSTFMIPTTAGFDVRGLGEAYPLNGPAWSLFFEYIGNLLYGLFIHRFSTKVLAGWTALMGVLLGAIALFGGNGDVGYGWQFSAVHFPYGLVRMLFPFSMGLLMYRVVRAGKMKGSFLIGSLLLIATFMVPRLGGDAIWVNGLFDFSIITLLFPLIVYMGISGEMKTSVGKNVCKFLGDISYPLYIVHYPFIYIYYAWVNKTETPIPFSESWPGALAVLFGSMLIAFVFTRIYDVPVRNYLMSLLKKKKSAKSLETVAR